MAATTNKNSMDRAKILVTGMAKWYILSGFFILTISILLDNQFHDINAAHFVIALLGHFSIGLLVIGILSILLETSHWLEYFKERLAEIVVGSKYLERLSPDELSKLQTEALKAYFKDQSIGGESGFLQHYKKNVQKFVASPFRTNVQSDVLIAYVPDQNDKIIVHEEMSWECRANGGKIQDAVEWEPNDGEFEKVENLCFKVEHPEIEGGSKSYKMDEFDVKWKTKNDGLIYPLKEYAKLDGLRITISSEVIVSKNKFMAWRMAHPSRGISLAVRYPEDLNINKELFGIGGGCREILQKGYYKLTSEKWVLPDEGIVYELV